MSNRWLLLFGCFVAAATAYAAPVQRTFVASTGNDANPCSLTLPCHALAAAIAQTCDLVQGYFLSGPLMADLVAAWMNGHASPRGRESGGLRRVV